jgi:hypothetical protein
MSAPHSQTAPRQPCPARQLGIGTSVDATSPAAVTGLPAGGVTAAAASQSGQLQPFFR